MKESLTYQKAGVNIDAGNALVSRIARVAKQTQRPEVLTGLGGFGALCELPSGYKQPVLVSGTDGVGTKLKLASALGIHDTIGIDLVAMCANDILTAGAEPLFFLDYFATSSLDVDVAEQVIQGIAEGCQRSGMALIGGETAEMPGIYHGDDYDLAGFCVGVAEKEQLLNRESPAVGDYLIALPSSGVHSNGFSLVHAILKQGEHALSSHWGEGRSLGEALLTPTQLYIASVLPLFKSQQVRAAAHITGGGLPENLPRVLPQGVSAQLDINSWQWPDIFMWLQKEGHVRDEEMYRTFNCGVGMVLVVSPQHVEAVLKQLDAEHAWVIGRLIETSGASEVLF